MACQENAKRTGCAPRKMSDANLLPEPKFVPELHPTFRPAILVNRAFEAAARGTGAAVDVGLELGEAGGTFAPVDAAGFAERSGAPRTAWRRRGPPR